MSPQAEEVVVDSDLLDAQYHSPDLRQRSLHYRSWRDKFQPCLTFISANCLKAQLLRQFNPLHLTGWTLRNLINNCDPPWDLKVR